MDKKNLWNMPSSPRPNRKFLSADRRVYNRRLPGDVVNPEYGLGGDSGLRQEDDLGEDKIENLDEELLARSVLRLNANVIGVVLGLLLGLIIFAATNILLIKGGEVVGPHLGLLGQFFIGYSVSFVGSLIGFAYGMLCGYIAGFLIGWIYNQVAVLKERRRN